MLVLRTQGVEIMYHSAEETCVHTDYCDSEIQLKQCSATSWARAKQTL